MYDESIETFNLHQLFAFQRPLGTMALVGQTCVFYEDLNGDLRGLFHGTENGESQIIIAMQNKEVN